MTTMKTLGLFLCVTFSLTGCAVDADAIDDEAIDEDELVSETEEAASSPTGIREISCASSTPTSNLAFALRVSGDGRIAKGLVARPAAKQLGFEKVDGISARAERDRVVVDVQNDGERYAISLARSVFTKAGAAASLDARVTSTDPNASGKGAGAFRCLLGETKAEVWGAPARDLYTSLAVLPEIDDRLGASKVLGYQARNVTGSRPGELSRVLCKADAVPRSNPSASGKNHFCSITMPALVTSVANGKVKVSYDLPARTATDLVRAMARRPGPNGSHVFTSLQTNGDGATIPGTKMTIACTSTTCRLTVVEADGFR